MVKIMFSMTFDCTDQRLRLSRAHLDEEADFDACLVVEPRESCQSGKAKKFRSENFVEKVFLESKN